MTLSTTDKPKFRFSTTVLFSDQISSWHYHNLKNSFFKFISACLLNRLQTLLSCAINFCRNFAVRISIWQVIEMVLGSCCQNNVLDSCALQWGSGRRLSSLEHVVCRLAWTGSDDSAFREDMQKINEQVRQQDTNPAMRGVGCS